MLAGTVALFLLSLVAMRFVQQQFFPASDRPELLVNLTLPQNASLEATQGVVARVEKLLKADPDIEHWSFYVGQGAIRFYLPLDAQLANSMPGFGFSTPVADRGWTMARVARTYDTLMRRLGYESYGAHGSDGGAMVARELGLLDPPGFLGLHVLHLFSFPSGDPSEFERLEPSDYAGLEHMQWFQSVGGYNQMNGSRPQTVAVGLADSPVGQLAYNELFTCFGNGTSLVSEEQILTQVSLYWFTNTMATAARYHFEEAHSGVEPQVSAARTGVQVFADDFQTIKVFAERDNTNIVHWSRHEQGGHFAALELPEVIAADLRVFFGPVDES